MNSGAGEALMVPAEAAMAKVAQMVQSGDSGELQAM
jgi:hypothetical protein